ncbi:diphthine--ammonia ligase [Candidatus Woesearchaeota archaeon]|nr:diphthine--ammonia ligase [Candidatus Woesearchaeota archaeon]
MKLAALFSGGKDSTMALYWAIKQGHEAKCLVTLHPQRDDSYMYQVPNVELTHYHSKALGIPLLTAKTSGVKEEELKELKEVLITAKKKYGIQGVTAGALASNYQKERVEKICKELNLKAFAPYWQWEPEKYLNEILKSGFKVVITAIGAEGLKKELLGQLLTPEIIGQLKKIGEKTRFHLGFEGGEAESIVIDCPIFKKRLEIVEAEKIIEGEYSGYLKIKKILLVDKS